MIFQKYLKGEEYHIDILNDFNGNYLDHCSKLKLEMRDGEIILRESPVDPVVDLPVKEMVSLTWEEGTSSSNASVMEEVDAMSYIPFMHSRYDSA